MVALHVQGAECQRSNCLNEEETSMAQPFIEIGERVRHIAHGKCRYESWPEGAWLEYGVTGTVTKSVPEYPALTIRGEYFEGIGPWALITWHNGGQTAISPEDEGVTWERVKSYGISMKSLDTFSLGKDLEKYVPGFKVEAIELPSKSSAFATAVGEIDDKKKKILIKLWPRATRRDALAILAHEYSHLQKGTTIIEKGLTESKVWERGETLASQWGVSEEYLKLATDLVEYYERTGSYPKITAGIKNWLSSFKPEVKPSLTYYEKGDKGMGISAKESQGIYWWVRLGYIAKYEKFDTFGEAKNYVEEAIGKPFSEAHWTNPYGFELGDYKDRNYISFFEGDRIARPIEQHLYGKVS